MRIGGALIPLKYFANTGHKSSRTIFGAAAFWSVTQSDADRILETLLQHGINHIDTAASYGDSELRIGSWMQEYRNDFFLATKTDKRLYKEAKEELYRSLDRLRVDHIDLWQMHNLINMEQWDIALSDGGAIDAFIEAKEERLVKFLGVTGHGLAAPLRHFQSLQKYNFDSVLLPYSYIFMKNEKYAKDFNILEEYCTDNHVAIQTIKSISRGSLDNKKSKFSVWYDPLDTPLSIANSVNWVLGNRNVFLNTAGDIELLPLILKAAENLTNKPTDQIMEEDISKYGITSLFKGDEI